MAIQFDYFFLIKKQNGECKVGNFRRLLFGMSPDVPAFKVHTFNFELEQTLVADILTHIFAHAFDFHYHINFAKNINMS